MPSLVRTRTVTACPLSSLSVTANRAVAPSLIVASPIDSFGESSLSRMVPVPVSSPSVAPLGLLSFTVKFSSGSSSASSFVCTSMVWLVVFASKVSLPDSRSKSVPSSAVPLCVAYATVTRS